MKVYFWKMYIYVRKWKKFSRKAEKEAKKKLKKEVLFTRRQEAFLWFLLNIIQVVLFLEHKNPIQNNLLCVASLNCQRRSFVRSLVRLANETSTFQWKSASFFNLKYEKRH